MTWSVYTLKLRQRACTLSYGRASDLERKPGTTDSHDDRTRVEWLVSVLNFQASEDDLDRTQTLMCSDD